jgi:hypothetical protein
MIAAPSFVPEMLLRIGPYRLALWQWIALPACALASLLAARLLGGVTHTVLRAVDVGRAALRESAWAGQNPASRSAPSVRSA